jgi:hypothetical protein
VQSFQQAVGAAPTDGLITLQRLQALTTEIWADSTPSEVQLLVLFSYVLIASEALGLDRPGEADAVTLAARECLSSWHELALARVSTRRIALQRVLSQLLPIFMLQDAAFAEGAIRVHIERSLTGGEPSRPEIDDTEDDALGWVAKSPPDDETNSVVLISAFRRVLLLSPAVVLTPLNVSLLADASRKATFHLMLRLITLQEASIIFPIADELFPTVVSAALQEASKIGLDAPITSLSDPMPRSSSLPDALWVLCALIPYAAGQLLAMRDKALRVVASAVRASFCEQRATLSPSESESPPKKFDPWGTANRAPRWTPLLEGTALLGRLACVLLPQESMAVFSSLSREKSSVSSGVTMEGLCLWLVSPVAVPVVRWCLNPETHELDMTHQELLILMGEILERGDELIPSSPLFAQLPRTRSRHWSIHDAPMSHPAHESGKQRRSYSSFPKTPSRAASSSLRATSLDNWPDVSSSRPMDTAPAIRGPVDIVEHPSSVSADGLATPSSLTDTAKPVTEAPAAAVDPKYTALSGSDSRHETDSVFLEHLSLIRAMVERHRATSHESARHALAEGEGTRPTEPDTWLVPTEVMFLNHLRQMESWRARQLRERAASADSERVAGSAATFVTRRALKALVSHERDATRLVLEAEASREHSDAANEQLRKSLAAAENRAGTAEARAEAMEGENRELAERGALAQQTAASLEMRVSTMTEEMRSLRQQLQEAEERTKALEEVSTRLRAALVAQHGGPDTPSE